MDKKKKKDHQDKTNIWEFQNGERVLPGTFSGHLSKVRGSWEMAASSTEVRAPAGRSLLELEPGRQLSLALWP